ncbi:MAG TPA: HD domain-containing protein, partial [Epsilonproteobacteria bacterium]|nr:HD domain-containing protein [Campylobacterota bacterium]
METVKAQIEEMLYNNEDDFKIAKVLKNDLKDYLSNLEALFKTTGGKDFLVRHTQKIDNLMKLVYKIALREMFGDYAPMKNNLPISMVALGSYGREQLCVHSDIDLMIVFEEIPGYNHTAFIEKILYILWDTGLKLGHRVHNIDELFSVSETDITIKTALIESRFIEGSSFVWTKTQNAIRQIRHHDTETFIADKLTEQQDKHHTYPLTMEPHLKEGVGGFRDANLVYWIGKVLYNADNIKNIPEKFISDKEYREFRIALEFLFRTRSALHLVAGKKEDRLRLDLIPGVSELLGYEQTGAGQMRFSKKVSESLKTIRLYSTIWIEMLTRQFLPPVMDSVFIMPEKADEKFLDLLQQLVSAADHPFSVHPTMLRLLTHASKPERINQTYYPTIFELFYKPHLFYVLRTLSHAKLLGYTLQPLQKVIDLPQFDGYHNFAVDIHSLECVRYLENIQDPFLAELHNTLNEDEKALLKMVVLLHDAGKGRKRDHHNVGVSLFKVFAQKLGMKPELIEMGETLILYHTTMSRVAQREDLHNNNTILKFASYFKTKKMLDLLYILTYADMSGVATDVYNTFSAKLLHTLYRRALEVLDQEELLDEAAQRVKKEEMV